MMNKFRRNVKALSPIFATLILIAIAVIAGIIVYMFTSGTLAAMMGGGSPGQEKAAVQGVTIASAASPASLAVYAQYLDGGNPIVINGALVKDANGTQAVGTVSGTLPVSGTLTTLTVSLSGVSLDITHSYTITLTSSKGGSFVSSSFP